VVVFVVFPHSFFSFFFPVFLSELVAALSIGGDHLRASPQSMLRPDLEASKRASAAARTTGPFSPKEDEGRFRDTTTKTDDEEEGVSDCRRRRDRSGEKARKRERRRSERLLPTVGIEGFNSNADRNQSDLYFS